MYKTSKEQQLTFDGFNQSCGMKLNPKDEYVILADMIDWAAVEAEYSALFKSRRGRPAASARMALGSLIIQKRANLSDRKLVKEIARNVSYQYFLGLQSFQQTSPIKHGVLPEFRKRLGKARHVVPARIARLTAREMGEDELVALYLLHGYRRPLLTEASLP